MALRINAENFEEKVLKADKPVLVDFYSDSCIPCKQMAGILGDIEDENEDDIYIYKVNVNYDRELAEKYKVMSVPTVICFGRIRMEMMSVVRVLLLKFLQMSPNSLR